MISRSLYSSLFIAMSSFNAQTVYALTLGQPTAPASSGYYWSELAEGATVYLDRNYIYDNVPGSYAGLDYLVTANGDKNISADSFLEFSSDSNVTVYVAYDTRITTTPYWLSDWTITDNALVTSDTSLIVYAKDFPAGTISLGGNYGTKKSSMYTVMVEEITSTSADITAPSTPDSLAATSSSNSSIALSWNASSDDTSVIFYNIYRDGTLVGSTTDTSYDDTGLTSGNSYTYFVKAVDASNNFSAQSNTATVTLATSTTAPADVTLPALGRSYSWTDLEQSALSYIDKTYIYRNVPATFLGASAIQTSNSDKFNSDDNFLNISFGFSGTMFVAYDIRNGLPAWLSDWNTTGETISTSHAALTVFSKAFAAGTFNLGGNNGLSKYDMYTAFVIPDATSNNEFPSAVSDSATTSEESAVAINVLGNDSGLSNGPVSVTISSGASNGQLSVSSENLITYTPVTGFTGTDSFSYMVTDADGDMANASVTVTVDCTFSCTHSMTVSWNHPAPDSVDGYILYTGDSATTAIEEVAEISIVAGNLDDPSAPSIEVDGFELGFVAGDTVCFSTKAFNAYGLSDYSETVCTEL